MMLLSLKYCTTYLLTKSQRSECIVIIGQTGMPFVKTEMTEISRHYYERNENSTKSVEENWSYIHDNLLKAIDTYVPVKFNSNRTNAPWITPQLKRLIRKKQRFYNKARRTKRSTDWAEYKCPRSGTPNYPYRTPKIHCQDPKFFK